MEALHYIPYRRDDSAVKKKFELILRHAVVSFICAGADYLTFLLLFSVLNFSLIVAFSISYITVSTLGFFGHVYFTFRLKSFDIRNVIYFVSQLFLAGIFGYFFLKFLLIYMPPEYAKLIQLFFVFFFSLLYGKLVTFKS